MPHAARGGGRRAFGKGVGILHWAENASIFDRGLNRILRIGSVRRKYGEPLAGVGIAAGVDVEEEFGAGEGAGVDGEGAGFFEELGGGEGAFGEGGFEEIDGVVELGAEEGFFGD